MDSQISDIENIATTAIANSTDWESIAFLFGGVIIGLVVSEIILIWLRSR